MLVVAGTVDDGIVVGGCTVDDGIVVGGWTVVGGLAVRDGDHARSLGADHWARDGRGFLELLESVSGRGSGLEGSDGIAG